jgi:hypothetical protein
MRNLTILLIGLALSGVGFTAGCEVHHTESDHPNLLGGETHTSETIIKNPDGSTSTIQSEQKTN